MEASAPPLRRTSIVPALSPVQRALAVAAALLVAGFAQYLIAIGYQSPVDLVLFIVAGAVFTLAIPAAFLPTAAIPAGTSRLSIGYRRAVVIILGCGLFGYCLRRWWENTDRGLAFFLWLFLMAGYIALFAGPGLPTIRRPSINRSSAVYWMLFAAIVVGSAIVSFIRLDNVPYGLWYDEANFGLFAHDILHGRVDFPFISPGVYYAALQLYIHAIAQALFGQTVFAPRSVAAASGVISVLCAGLFAATVWNRTFALTVMTVLAFMRWRIDFSRIGMNESVFVAAELVVACCLAMAIKTRRPVWAAATGVATGLTMHIYFPADALTPLVALVLLVAVVRARFPAWLLVLVAAGFILAYSPLVEAGIQDPAGYSGRATQVSIFSSANTEPPLQAFEHNLRAHVLMFNVNGDQNGRHNVPGQPQLDQISAALFILGIAWAIGHSRRLLYLGVLVWFLAMIAPGVLSLDFEAPQSARGVGALVPVAFLIAIALYGSAATVYRGLTALAAEPIARTATIAAAALALLVISWINVSSYFDAEYNNETVWESYSTAQTFAGRESAKLPPSEPVYASPDLAGTPSLLYLTPNRQPTGQFFPSNDIPVPADNAAAVFLSTLDAEYRTVFRTFYPHLTLRPLKGPNPGVPPFAYEILLNRRDLDSILGLNLSSPSHARSTIVRDHLGTFSGPSSGSSVVWSGGFQVPAYGTATLTFRAAGHLAAAIDGNTTCSGNGIASCTALWPIGNHSLRIEITGRPSGAPATLSWAWQSGPTPRFYRTPLMSHGLTATYYSNDQFQGPPVLSRVEPEIYYYYQYIPNLAIPYSVRWSGRLHVPRSGTYTFGLEVEDEAQFSLDGRPVLSAQHSVQSTAARHLSAGWHALSMQMRGTTNNQHIYFTWRPPGASTLTPIPFTAFGR